MLNASNPTAKVPAATGNLAGQYESVALATPSPTATTPYSTAFVHNVTGTAAIPLYFSKLWWAGGLANLRDAVRLDPRLKNNEDLIKTVVRAFNMTPSYDYRLANFLIEIGALARPLVE